MSGTNEKAGKVDLFNKNLVSIDLEVNPKTNAIFKLAAVREGAEGPLIFGQGDFQTGLSRLDEYSDLASIVIGHNFLNFDAVHLESARQSLRLLKKPVVDTLWLNPLAFPRNPYHHLVKHYQDGRLQAGQLNDPKLDADLTLQVLKNQISALSEMNRTQPELVSIYHYLTTRRFKHRGFGSVFHFVRERECPDISEIERLIREFLEEEACISQIDPALKECSDDGWPLAYALAWISVSGGDSVMPPWVRLMFPEASRLVRRLRDTSCTHTECKWCRTQNNPRSLLQRWFGYDDFRLTEGKPLQEEIVSNSMSKKSLLGILPTGAGKSVCYQIPALSHFTRTGALTVVISPLVALMADQVEGMRKQGISSCITINGMLSLPERQEALDQVRLGSAAILLISPEQLRSPSVRSVLKQREVGHWVFDEAHCVSKWGHDFRPDYRYVARFIREYSGDDEPAPILCLTATAKPDVIVDIRNHFETRLGILLDLFDGGSVRDNLTFEVQPTSKATKLGDVLKILQDMLPSEGSSGAIVYCSRRSMTERVAGFLKERGYSAAHYHAGINPEEKREVQQAFSNGELRVIAATNAFGMGIDKPDIRLVVHADIPGSLENYLQEAGRAGRDREHAHCVLLFHQEDIETQFNLSARSRLERREIGAILKSLRSLDKRMKQKGVVVATAGEIVKVEKDTEFQRDSTTDDTRVKTAVSWLEEAVLLRREENRTRVFPSSIRVDTVQAAEEILQKATITESYRKKLAALIDGLMNAPKHDGITTDELCGLAGLSPGGMMKALSDLEALGIASNDTAISAFVNIGIENSSEKRLTLMANLEKDLIEHLQVLAPDLEMGEDSVVNLKILSQCLRDDGHPVVRPDIADKLIRSLARDGVGDEGGVGSLQVRKIDRGHLKIRLKRNWAKLGLTAEYRRLAARVVLTSLQQSAPQKSRGKDIRIETTLGTLMDALKSDIELSAHIKEPSKLLNHALIWLHEQGVITLGKGLTIFRPAMTIHLSPEKRQYTDADFDSLKTHYQEQTLQTHIMGAYADQGLTSITRAQELSEDYFSLDKEKFVQKWLQSRSGELSRQTTTASWQAIVSDLQNSNQIPIVSDDRESTNVLVLAGPGSGKTRVLVHRIAYLIRVKRENPRGILALVYNRHAATEIRVRLQTLIGDDARDVTISTCHGLAMRLVGASFIRREDKVENIDFNEILTQAVELLRGTGLSDDEAEAQRNTLLEGYRWILVDEYQDVGPQEYELISAVAGRTIEESDQRLSLFAVGDDDQNIYSFKGASVEFIRRFENDYNAKASFLIENYRSTRNIIDAANKVISPGSERMKEGKDICVNRQRRNQDAGGHLVQFDSLGRGRVQVFQDVRNSYMQAVFALDEFERLSRLDPNWDWSKTAIIAREWKYLNSVRSLCEAHGIPVDVANEEPPNFWRLRETQLLVDWIKSREMSALDITGLRIWMKQQGNNRWWDLIKQAVDEFSDEVGDTAIDRRDFLEWIAEWGRSIRKRQSGLLLLSAHRAKGLEFDHVAVLDGAWDKRSDGEDVDAARRLYYVAMTRAQQSLSLFAFGTNLPFVNCGNDAAFLLRPNTNHSVDISNCRNVYQTLTQEHVDLDFVGRLNSGHSVFGHLHALKIGDPLLLERTDNKFYLKTRSGSAVCKLSRKFSMPKGVTFKHASVYAVLRRFREDSGDSYREKVWQDSWDLVLPELVFEAQR